MKKLALAAALIAGLTCSTNSFSQMTAPLAGPPAAGPGPRPPVELPVPGAQGLVPITTVQGKVVKLQANDDFTFDGFFMINGTDSVLVKFPPHMGKQILPFAKTGSQITVSGVLENPPFGVKEMRMINMTAAGKTLTDTPPATLPTPVQETLLTSTGKVTSFQTDRQGRVNGLFIDDKTVLRFPPHISAQLGNSVGKGTAVSYSGNQKGKEQGEISLEDYKVIRCSTITVNGQQYLVR